MILKILSVEWQQFYLSPTVLISSCEILIYDAHDTVVVLYYLNHYLFFITEIDFYMKYFVLSYSIQCSDVIMGVMASQITYLTIV